MSQKKLMIDTHTHIFSDEFKEDISLVIARAKTTGIIKVLLPNIDIDSINSLNSLATDHLDFCLPMMGLHPCSVNREWDKQLSIIKSELLKHNYVAIGEIGLDFYWDTEFKSEQISAFKEQLKWSTEMNLPVSIHSRNSIPETIKSIEEIGADKLRGVFHSFTGSVDELKQIVKLDNFMVGVNGVVTFKNSSLATTLNNVIDLTRIVIETDAPYLSPVPYRGKRNEPSYLTNIVDKLAQTYNTTPDMVAEITTKNAIRMFDIS